MANFAMRPRVSAPPSPRPGDSDPNPDEALRRVRATRPGGGR